MGTEPGDAAALIEYWLTVRFRDDQVLARVNATGEYVLVNGMVPIRYKPGGKIYRTRADRLIRIDGQTPESHAATPAAPRPSKPTRAGGRAKIPDLSSLRDESEAIQVWTDGACSGNPGPAGSGVLLRHQGRIVERWDYLGMGTNNIAELTAILRGLELVEDQNAPVDVVSDSTYSIGLLTQGWKAKKNPELVAELRALVARFTDLRFIKVPGHAGVPDNERADELARRAVSERASGST